MERIRVAVPGIVPPLVTSFASYVSSRCKQARREHTCMICKAACLPQSANAPYCATRHSGCAHLLLQIGCPPQPFLLSVAAGETVTHAVERPAAERSLRDETVRRTGEHLMLLLRTIPDRQPQQLCRAEQTPEAIADADGSAWMCKSHACYSINAAADSAHAAQGSSLWASHASAQPLIRRKSAEATKTGSSHLCTALEDRKDD